MYIKLFIRPGIAFFILYLSTRMLCAQEMTWQDIVQEAKLHNSTIKKAAYSLAGIRLEHKKAISNFLPQLSASASSNRSATEIIDDNYRYLNTYTYGVWGTLSIFSGFSDMINLKTKNIDIGIETGKYRRIVSDVFYSLAKSYVNLLSSQEMITLTKEIYERRCKNYEIVQQKYKVGREDKGSFLIVEAAMVQAEYDYIQAKRSFDEQAGQLLREIGSNTTENLTVKGDFQINVSSNTPSFDLLVDKTPEYVIANYNLEKSKLNVKAVKSVFYPVISVSANISKSGNDFPIDTVGWNTGINLSLPLFAGGRNHYNLEIAKTNELSAEKSFKETETELHSILISAWNSFLASAETVKVKEKYLIASEEQSRIVTRREILRENRTDSL